MASKRKGLKDGVVCVRNGIRVMKQFTSVQLGKYLRRVRQKLGVSGRRVAKEIGISGPYLTQIETAVVGPPSVAVLSQLARRLKLNPDELLARVGKIAEDVEAAIARDGPELAIFLREFSLCGDKERRKLLSRWEQELAEEIRVR